LHFVAFESHWIGTQSRLAAEHGQVLPGGQVVLPTVPGAGHAPSADPAVVERVAQVVAVIFDSADTTAADREHRDVVIAHPYRPAPPAGDVAAAADGDPHQFGGMIVH
jgi:hypothetical protein